MRGEVIEVTERLAHRFALYVERQGAVEADKRDQLEYGIFHFLSSSLHIFFLFVAGVLCSAIMEILAFCLCFCTLKHYIGGAHANKHWKCLWGFTLLATVSALGVRSFYIMGLPALVSLIAVVIALVVILFRAPVLHPNSPVYSHKKLKTFRRKAIAIACAQLVVICICLRLGNTLSMLALCGSAGSLAASASLLLPIRIRLSVKGGAHNEK